MKFIRQYHNGYGPLRLEKKMRKNEKRAYFTWKKEKEKENQHL